MLMQTSSYHAYDVIRLYYGPTGSVDSFIPYPYHTPGEPKFSYRTVYDSFLGCYLLYLAVYLHLELGHRFGSLFLHFEYIVLGWDSGVLKWECFCLVIIVFSRGMSVNQ